MYYYVFSVNIEGVFVAVYSIFEEKWVPAIVFSRLTWLELFSSLLPLFVFNGLSLEGVLWRFIVGGKEEEKERSATGTSFINFITSPV